MISAIVAVDENWGIGYNGDLLAHIPNDLKYFKELTTGNTVVMGRKTWDSLPIKPLPNRGNFIISRETPLLMENKAIRMNLDMIKDTMKANENENYFIIVPSRQLWNLAEYNTDKNYIGKLVNKKACSTGKKVDSVFHKLFQILNNKCFV